MEISSKMKERFCRDCNIPIKLFQEPYFSDRIKLYDKFYGTIYKWNVFVTELEKYKCEQDYLEEYNKVKDQAIQQIQNTEAYQRFNAEDMNKFTVIHKNLPGKDIFKPSNDGKFFISIDMKKANFSSLHAYDKGIFNDVDTWEQFISQFTNNQHIINSKYIRQVILGNCNPKRHITYEKHIMDEIVDIFALEKIVFFSNDEVVYDVTEVNFDDLYFMLMYGENRLKNFYVPFRIELFSLHKIHGADGYYKKIYRKDGEYKYSIEFKCLNNYMIPFVIRKFLGEEFTESDCMFYNEGLLSKFVEVPNIEVDFNGTIEN